MTPASYSPGAACLRLFADLRRARSAGRLRQVDLADRLQISVRTFQRWENSDSEPSMSELIRWAAALGMAITVRPIGEPDNLVVSPLLINQSAPDRSDRPALQ